MTDNLDRFDMDAITEAFYRMVNSKKPQKLGKFFRDSTGLRWKYLARAETTYIASHGEFGVVMVIRGQPDGTNQVTLELKKLQDEHK